MVGGDLMDRVALIVQETSAEVIEPRFACLAEGEVREKVPGELVTVADDEAEALLTRRLSELLPGVPVIAEEACSGDPSLLAAVDSDRAWLVDPLDGTANFVAGSSDWAVMVALLDRGETVAGWIWRPCHGLMYEAEHRGGATVNGARLVRSSASSDVGDLRGAVLRRFLDPSTAATVTRNSVRFANVGDGTKCAGVDYPSVVDGDLDFVLFWRTMAWDHAPGALLAEEAGAVVRRLDRGRYRPGQREAGLLVAADHQSWDLARQILD